MSSKHRALFSFCVPLFIAVLFAIPWLSSHFSRANASSSSTIIHPIQLVPSQLTLRGNVATVTNTKSYCTEPWLSEVPTGTIIIGVDPTSCNPSDWDGGSATAKILLEDVFSPTIMVLKLSWPDRDGKGLYSPGRNRVANIFLDGHPLWGKRTTELSASGDYYAAEHHPVLTTILVTQSVTHTLVISVPPHTAWHLSQIELTAYPYPETVRGIGYSPYRDCQAPGTEPQPTVEDVREDLFRLFHTTNAIRTYSATGINGEIPQLANEIGLPIFAGAWVDGTITDAINNDIEIQALIDLANTTDLDGLIVGNEYYLRSGRTITDACYLLCNILQVRSGIDNRDLPITTAEIDNLMFTWENNSATKPEGINPIYRPILDEVDFVLVHIYPFWNKLPIDGAAAFTVSRYKAIQALLEQEYPGQNKRLIIGETGWPSGGAPNGAAVPSPANQRRYMLEFLYLAEQEDVEYMYFDAFDELWKVEEPGGVGKRWGYSHTDRTAKYNFYGVLLPTEILFPHRVYLPCVLQQSTSGTLYPPTDWESTGITPAGSIYADSKTITSVYTEWPEENFFPTGWMGNINSIGLYGCDRSDPHSGELSIQVSFSPTDTTGFGQVYTHTNIIYLPLVIRQASTSISTAGWGGVYWQHPPDNWGTVGKGLDLSGVSRLTFWVRGDQGGEVVEFLVGGLGKPSDLYPDTIRPASSSGLVELSDTWQQVEVDLENKDLSNVIGGFAWVASSCYNDEPITFYLDDIAFDPGPEPEPLPAPTRRPFYVYRDSKSTCNHFAPSLAGDLTDITLDIAWTGAPYRGATAISVTYSAQMNNGEGWAGIYWQEPEENWGNIDGGFDLSWANKVTFRAMGARGGERVQFTIGGIHDKNAPYPDSLKAGISTGFIELTNTWQEYTINLRGQDLTRVIGGFSLTTDQCANPDGATFYLDDIAFEFDPDLPEPSRVFPIYTDAGDQNNHYSPSGWMGDAQYPGRTSFMDCWNYDQASGHSAIRISYPRGAMGWAGMYWLHPMNNWGNDPEGGYDLTGADRLTFYARSDIQGARVKFLIGGIGYPNGTKCSRPSESYPDSVCPKIEEEKILNTFWTEYVIDLNQYSRDLSNVIGGFGWVADRSVILYLDEIVYEFD